MVVLKKGAVIKIGDKLYMACQKFNFDLVATTITDRCVEAYGCCCNDDILHNMIEWGMIKPLEVEYIGVANCKGIQLKENKQFLSID